MKKILFIFCACLQVFFTHAQNWAVFNPAYRYNYSLENEAYTTSVIFADSILNSGTDLVYSLNRIVTKCDTCHQSFWQMPGATDSSYWLSDQPQFLQRRIIYSGSDYRLSDTSTYYIKHLAPAGSSWIFNTTHLIIAQVLNVSQKNIFGNIDSVKTILLSTNDTIILSKQFGLIKYPAKFGNTRYYKLRGIENKGSYTVTGLYGEKVPNYFDFLKLKVGSIFYYSSINAYAANYCSNMLYGIKTVLSSSLSGTVITNTLRDQKIGCPTLSRPTCTGGCDILTWHNTRPYGNINALETSTVQPSNTIFDQDSIYNKGYNNQLYKETYLGMYHIFKYGMTSNLHFYKAYGASCFSHHIQSNPLRSTMYETITLMTTSNPHIFYNSGNMSYEGSGTTYITGYGQVNNYGNIFEANNEYCTSLIIDGTDSLGGTDAITIGIDEAVMQDNINRIFPNPAKYIINVQIPYEMQTKGTVELMDAIGTIISNTASIGQSVIQLNIESLANGMYFLKLSSGNYSKTYKLIKD